MNYDDKLDKAIDMMMERGVHPQDCLKIVNLIQEYTLDKAFERLRQRLEDEAKKQVQ